MVTFRKPIGSVSVSGHKFVGAPVPCGVVITRMRYVMALSRCSGIHTTRPTVSTTLTLAASPPARALHHHSPRCDAAHYGRTRIAPQLCAGVKGAAPRHSQAEVLPPPDWPCFPGFSSQ